MENLLSNKDDIINLSYQLRKIFDRDIIIDVDTNNNVLKCLLKIKTNISPFCDWIKVNIKYSKSFCLNIEVYYENKLEEAKKALNILCIALYKITHFYPHYLYINENKNIINVLWDYTKNEIFISDLKEQDNTKIIKVEPLVDTKLNVFIGCSASKDISSIYRKSSQELLSIILKDNNLVFGGYNDSLMGDCYNTTIYNNNEVIAAVPQSYKNDLNNITYSKGIITKNISERTEVLIHESDIIIILPGGIGTLQELITAINDKNNMEINKPILIFNYNGFYNELFEMFNELENKKFTIMNKNTYVKFENLQDIINYFKEIKTECLFSKALCKNIEDLLVSPEKDKKLVK